MIIPRPLLLLLSATLVALSLAALVLPSPAQAQGTIEARVSRIIDGDTFTLSGESRRIRVWGLDAPERNERGATAATNAMRALISGQILRCQIRDIDRYGRYVGQCFLPDGRDITAEMIRMGVATEYCYFSRNYYRTCR